MSKTENNVLREALMHLQRLDELELQEVMAAIQKRYADTYPQWEVFYLAVHRDPALRRSEVEQLLNLICKGLDWKITIHKGGS